MGRHALLHRFSETGKMSMLFLEMIFFLGYFEQQITGFGAALFCLPFSLLILPREMFVPITLSFTLLQSLCIAVRWRRHIAKKQLAIVLVCALLVGIPAADMLILHLPEKTLKLMLAAFTAIYSIHCLRQLRKQDEQKLRPASVSWCACLMPMAGGIIQTAYGAGGPLLIAYLSRTVKGKPELRATICCCWVALNSIILCKYLWDGLLDPETLKTGLFLLPAVLAGTLTGEKVVSHISQRKFSILIYYILIISAGFLLL